MTNFQLCRCAIHVLALSLWAHAAAAQTAPRGDQIPAEFMTPSKSWRTGSAGLTVHLDKWTGRAQAPSGAAQVIHFEKNGPGTLRQETFLQANAYGVVKSTLTTIDATVTVGTVTDDEGVTASTLTIHPVRGDYKIVDNGKRSERPIPQDELMSSKFSGKTYAVLRRTDPGSGREVLMMIDLGANKRVDDTDTVFTYSVYVP